MECNLVWNHTRDMILDQNCTTQSSITTLLHPLWNQTVFVNINIISTSGNPVLNFDGLQKGCDLEQKIVRFVNKLHVGNQPDCKNNLKDFKWV